MSTNTEIKAALDHMATMVILLGNRPDSREAVDTIRAEVARLQAALEASQPADQQGDGELPQDERAAFEVWADKAGHPFDDTEEAFGVWQASAALAQRATEPPSFSRDPDGDLALDWHVGDDVLSVSFGTDGRVAWAATIAGKSLSGSEQVAQRAGSGEMRPDRKPCQCAPVGGCVTQLNLPESEYCRASCWSPNDGPVTAPPAAVRPDIPAASGESPCIEDRDGIPAAIRMVIQSRGSFDALRGLYRLINIWGAEQRATATPVQPDSGRDAALRNIISNAIHGYGCQIEDHAGVVDAIAKALAAQPSEQAAAAPQKKEG